MFLVIMVLIMVFVSQNIIKNSFVKGQNSKKSSKQQHKCKAYTVRDTSLQPFVHATCSRNQ